MSSIYNYRLFISLVQRPSLHARKIQTGIYLKNLRSREMEILNLAHASGTVASILKAPVASYREPVITNNRITPQCAFIYLSVPRDHIRDNKQKVVYHKIFLLACPGYHLYSLFNTMKDTSRKGKMTFSKVVPSNQTHHLSFQICPKECSCYQTHYNINEHCLERTYLPSRWRCSPLLVIIIVESFVLNSLLGIFGIHKIR